jgi:hypothetical protein
MKLRRFDQVTSMDKGVRGFPRIRMDMLIVMKKNDANMTPTLTSD